MPPSKFAPSMAWQSTQSTMKLLNFEQTAPQVSGGEKEGATAELEQEQPLEVKRKETKQKHQDQSAEGYIPISSSGGDIKRLWNTPSNKIEQPEPTASSNGHLHNNLHNPYAGATQMYLQPPQYLMHPPLIPHGFSKIFGKDPEIYCKGKFPPLSVLEHNGNLIVHVCVFNVAYSIQLGNRQVIINLSEYVQQGVFTLSSLCYVAADGISSTESQIILQLSRHIPLSQIIVREGAAMLTVAFPLI